MSHSLFLAKSFRLSLVREFGQIDRDRILGRRNIQNLNVGLCAADFLLGPLFASQHGHANVERTRGRSKMIIFLECLSTHGHHLEPLTLINSFFTLPPYYEADRLCSHVIYS